MENTYQDKRALYEAIGSFLQSNYCQEESCTEPIEDMAICAEESVVKHKKKSTDDSREGSSNLNSFFRDLCKRSVNYITPPSASRSKKSRGDSSSAASTLDFEQSVIDRLEDSFGTLLLQAINKRGLNNADVYKDANIDRRLFSKIISNEGYTPTKNTVLALAIALKLNLDETTSFLKSAGYALSHSSKTDIIVEFFIGETNGNYNIDIVNDALLHFDLPMLGSRL
ncbi:MAG: helix-turn-helix domain-containing protein [Bacteroidales bacterium]|nr:helix-turn-helix domain-containing protein [Bacteroidales bacterium]